MSALALRKVCSGTADARLLRHRERESKINLISKIGGCLGLDYIQA